MLRQETVSQLETILVVTGALAGEAIGKLLMVRRRLLEEQITLRIHGVSPGLYTLLHMIKLDQLFDIKK